MSSFGRKSLAFLGAILLGLAAYTMWKRYFRAEDHGCARIARLCNAPDKALEDCRTDIADLSRRFGAVVARTFAECVAGVQTCREAEACRAATSDFTKGWPDRF
jgi:hypothetical protein